MGNRGPPLGPRPTFLPLHREQGDHRRRPWHPLATSPAGQQRPPPQVETQRTNAQSAQSTPRPGAPVTASRGTRVGGHHSGGTGVVVEGSKGREGLESGAGGAGPLVPAKAARSGAALAEARVALAVAAAAAAAATPPRDRGLT